MLGFPRRLPHGIILGLNATRPFIHKAAMLWLALLCGAGIGGLAPTARGASPSSAFPDPERSPEPEERALGAATASAVDSPIEGRVDPDTYRIGPGDEFALRYSDLLDPRILRVAPSGELLLPDAGPVSVAGLTLRQAQGRVRDVLRPYVRGKGFVLALHRPRRFRLPVLGDVERPGVVTLQAPVRASEAVAAAGGVASGGARRGIQVRRGPDTLWVDLVRYTRAGELDANPFVFETDVVYVPPGGKRLEILGAVPHPGRYDFVDGDRLSLLLALGGMPLPEAALENAELARIQPDGTRQRLPIHLASVIASPGGQDDLPLLEGDGLLIPSRAHWRETATVWIEGEVARPGPYSIDDRVDRLRSMIQRAGGYTEFADRLAVQVERLNEYAASDTAFLHFAREKEQLLSPAERSYVVMRTKERNALSALVGSLLEAGDTRGDVALYDQDRIVVPRRVPLVSVQGEVRAPGYVPYAKGWYVEDYVRAAGNFSSRAYKSRMRVTLAATGRQVGADEAGELHPGDTVWVPTKPDRNHWATIRDLIGVAASAAAIIIAIQALNQ